MGLTEPALVLIDANLLVLLIVGAVSKRLIERHKKTRTFTPRDFDLLLGHLGPRALLLLPNVVTETSNLLAFHPESDRWRLFSKLRDIVSAHKEHYVASKRAAEHRHFRYLGLTDAAILSADRETEILTTDALLYAAALRHGLTAVNFNHLRDGLTV